MSLSLIFWLFVCGLISLAIAYVQYFYRVSFIHNRWVLGGFRFVGVFLLLLLLVNPGFKREELELQKQRLIFLFDNSTSIDDINHREPFYEIKQKVKQDASLNERFNIAMYTFGQKLTRGDSLTFSESQTNLDGALQALEQTFYNEKPIVVTLTDGQQNWGREYTAPNLYKSKVYPVVVGDTSAFKDLRINQININRYALAGNQFPIEVLYSYTGPEKAGSEIQIYDNDTLVYRETLQLAKGNFSGKCEVNLNAQNAGLHLIRVVLKPIDNEIIKLNNTEKIGIEVLEDRLKIVLVSRSTHPDIGTLKRSIASNPQREFAYVTPNEAMNQSRKGDIYILFNPNAEFEPIFSDIIKAGIPSLTFAGPGTDWGFLNRVQEVYAFEDSGIVEDILPDWNVNFDYYSQKSLENTNLPPLAGHLGTLNLTLDHQNLLFKSYRGSSSLDPLMTLIRSERREGLMLGTGIWKWRMQDFREHGNFEAFDSFFNAIWMFLAADGASGRFTVDYPPVFQNLTNARMTAYYFDEAYRFDPNAEIELQLKDSLGNPQTPIRFSLDEGEYRANLNLLPPGTYTFKAQVLNSEFSKSGQFNLQSQNLESLVFGANTAALSRLATNTGGRLYFSDQSYQLLEHLLQSNQYTPIQISHRKVVSLRNLNWIYFLIVFSFIGEWFLRKYHGLV